MLVDIVLDESKSVEVLLFVVVEVKLPLVELEVDVVVLVLVEVVVVEVVVVSVVVFGAASTILQIDLIQVCMLVKLYLIMFIQMFVSKVLITYSDSKICQHIHIGHTCMIHNSNA